MTKNPSSMTQDQSSQNTKSTFLKLENSYFNLLTEIESQREKENLKLSLYQKSLHLNIALIFLCLVMGVISFFKFLKKRSGIEKNAEKELNLKEDLNQKSAKEILSTALDFADLPKCQHLLDEFTKNALYGKKDKKEKLEKIEADLNLEKAPIVQAPYETILPSTPRAVKSEEIKESSISDVSSFKEEDNKIDVPEILAQIIEQLSIQFFAKGIKLEINVAADLSLDWEKDAFEQILYEAITRTLSINPTHMFLDFEEEAKVTVFKVSFMARSELSKGMIQDHFSLASTFMSEFGGVIKYIEIEKFHFSVDLYFTKDLETKKKKTKSKKELVRFRKASKRELQAQLFN